VSAWDDLSLGKEPSFYVERSLPVAPRRLDSPVGLVLEVCYGLVLSSEVIGSSFAGFFCMLADVRAFN